MIFAGAVLPLLAAHVGRSPGVPGEDRGAPPDQCPRCGGKGTIVRDGPSEYEYDNKFPCPVCDPLHKPGCDGLNHGGECTCATEGFGHVCDVHDGGAEPAVARQLEAYERDLREMGARAELAETRCESLLEALEEIRFIADGAGWNRVRAIADRALDWKGKYLYATLPFEVRGECPECGGPWFQPQEMAHPGIECRAPFHDGPCAGEGEEA